ncbi:hypothetical protein EZJ49_06505 [Bdellovibrio bacteriovorus]|uniref:hypothetical protein n=1 Tax=Bdellovibrio bacteriovorus TaxID=959 RepID=UPI0021CFC782|nr:hypothetical protein [Bdellovibrio bacteriovorus]UXR65897.1 hypothetical protein EZJ49_06505 [Bdellovibrio bacteriovorus]
MKLSFLLLILTTFIPVHTAVQHILCPALLPDSVMPPASATEEISETQFTELLDLFARNHPDIIFQGSWTNDTLNAQALRFDQTRVVVVYGGLARHPSMTLDSLTLMICHEVGHHKGGAPYFPDILGNISWASGEGAADYYSVKGCFRQMAQQLPSRSLKVSLKENILLGQTCEKQNNEICYRALVAGAITAQLQWLVLPKDYQAPSLSRMEAVIAETTLLDYPSPQCRLDTFRASALSLERPACWYRSE